MELDDLTLPLLLWYRENARDLPWRKKPTAYHVWVSEIMLQQTRVAAVLPYFARFMEALPTVAALAAADERQLMALWQGLGYYSRARNLQKAARIITGEHGGVFPDTYEALTALPGVGDYTAGAIASIAFGRPVPAVDGNVLRLAARLSGYDGNVLEPKVRALIRQWMAEVIPHDRPGAFNQALMELGATLCSPTSPRCEECPWQESCDAFDEGDMESLPIHEKKKPQKILPVAVCLLTFGKRVFVMKRTERLLNGLFVFALLEGETLDADFKEMVQQEVSEKSQDVAELENNLKILLLPKDANDEKSVILELRGGAGGEEAALFAHSLMRMYSMYVQSRGWEWEVLNLNETELGGVKEAIIAVNGRGAYNRLKYESGVHRVQRVPETETQGRIHTSTATVAVMPQAEEVDFALDMKDLRIDTFRSSGAGGQHINKTSSAIRVTHLPTGMVVECQNERSQFQNKDKALEILRSRLLAQKQKEQQDAINANRAGQVGTGDRSEKIRTYNFPQDRCTDHRIGLTVHNLEKIMDGNLDEVIDALATHEQTEKLQRLGG